MRADPYPSRIRSEPEWLPRQDPVVHTGWTAAAPLSQRESEAFERDGYLVLQNLFGPDEVTALQAELAALRADPKGIDPETLIAEPNSRALRSIFAIHRQNALFRRLARDARLVDIARYLLGDEVYLHQSRLNHKGGFTGKEFYWHSDFETWHVEDGMPRMRALSMSIQLAENHPWNGPLMVMPGSHQTYVTCVGETPDDHYRQSLRKQEYGVPDDDSLTRLADAGGIAAPTGPAGSVVIFDCNTMHGSNGNISPYPRANAFIVYNAVSNALAEPWGGTAPRPGFIAERDDFSPLGPVRGVLTGRDRAA